MKWVPWWLKPVRSESRILHFLRLGILFFSESAKFSRGLVFALGVKSCFPSTDGKLCQCLQTWISGIKPTETEFCTEPNVEGRNHPAALSLLGFLWREVICLGFKNHWNCCFSAERSVKDFHVWWGAESSFCQLWVHLELLKELFWPGWDFPANIGAASPINHMCHIFQQALPVVCANPGAQLVPVVLWDFLFL